MCGRHSRAPPLVAPGGAALPGLLAAAFARGAGGAIPPMPGAAPRGRGRGKGAALPPVRGFAFIAGFELLVAFMTAFIAAPLAAPGARPRSQASTAAGGGARPARLGGISLHALELVPEELVEQLNEGDGKTDLTVTQCPHVLCAADTSVIRQFTDAWRIDAPIAPSAACTNVTLQQFNIRSCASWNALINQTFDPTTQHASFS